jgi:hypothetical protein
MIARLLWEVRRGWLVGTETPSYRGFRYPVEIIGDGVWLRSRRQDHRGHPHLHRASRCRPNWTPAATPRRVNQHGPHAHFADHLAFLARGVELHRRPTTPTVAEEQAGAPDPALDRTRALELLADPTLTGMSRPRLDELVAQLDLARAAQTANAATPGAGADAATPEEPACARPLLTDTDRVVLTLVYLRQHCSQKVLAELLEINPHSIGEAIADTRQLFDEHGHTTSPTTTRFTTVVALSRFLTTGAPPTARPHVPALLSVPSLTGMPRAQLVSLIERLSVRQAAEAERRLYHRRGGERLPGARGGVFFEKITDAERVLITVLYQRQVCTRKILAELFEVTRPPSGSPAAGSAHSSNKTATSPHQPRRYTQRPPPFSTP